MAAAGRSPERAWRTVICGLAMGTADAVPGVSGGTIALILGIYDRLIGSLADVVAVLRHPADAATWRGLRRALVFLVPLGGGVISALWLATKALVGEIPKQAVGEQGRAYAERLLATPPDGWIVRPDTAPIVFAFFFGLVLMSVGEPWRTRKSSSRMDYVLVLIGAGLAAGLGLGPPAAGSLTAPALVGAGAVAISVMLLPGVSGSLALLVLGMYQPVSGAVHDREIGILAWFALGMGLGVATFVPFLRWVLARWHDRTMAFLSGLMAGSLAALWPWKAHFLPKMIPWLGPMSPEAPSGTWWEPLIAAVAGGALITLVGRTARKRAQAALSS